MAKEAAPRGGEKPDRPGVLAVLAAILVFLAGQGASLFTYGMAQLAFVNDDVPAFLAFTGVSALFGITGVGLALLFFRRRLLSWWLLLGLMWPTLSFVEANAQAIGSGMAAACSPYL